MKTGIFYAVGVGTEPLDLTLRAKQVLETAEVLVTPITRAGEPSAAARIAEQVVSFSGGVRRRRLCNGSGCWYLCLFCWSSKGKVQLV